MSKTILFPTDFSIASLKPIQAAISDHPDEKLDLVLIHGIHASDSITDLLFFSKSALVSDLSNEAFDSACKLLQNLFSNRINSLRIELFTGFTQSAFSAFLDGLRANKLYIPFSKLELTNKLSMDLSSFIAKSNVEKVSHSEGELKQSSQAVKLFSQINFAK